MKFIDKLIYSNHPGIRISRHVLFWVSDIFNYFMVVSINETVTEKEAIRILLIMPTVILATYFVLYYVLPKFSQPSQRGQLILIVIGVIVFLGIFVRAYKYYLLFPWIYGNSHIPADQIWDLRHVIREILSSVMVISLAVAIKVLKNKNELEAQNELLRKEKKAAELSFLKAQMQPHFLFNTLNTLYSETLQQSPKAEAVVLHLSNLLRFILDECNKPLIAVEKEIQVIRNFIELERLRHGSRLEVQLSTPEKETGLLISPLLFLPFIENSFRHSLETVRGPISITVVIRQEGNELTLLVENDYQKVIKPKNGARQGGRGISNVRRQLDLLYDKAYSLSIEDEDEKFRVALQISLNAGHEKS